MANDGAGVEKGTGRFEIQRQIGEGAFGSVYQVFDRQRESIVALKTLHQVGADALFHFKNEFRALADLSHPNLVSLYELLSDGKHWSFTMELVDGVDFLEFLRGLGRQGLIEGAQHAPITTDFEMVRTTTSQLAKGVSALHDAGKLHRDIKPPNVLVTREARVVLLDFGLVADMSIDSALRTSQIVGTPAYMSPEQAARQPLTPASDWYSVGVMLFQALTGVLPFEGETHEILSGKQERESVRASVLVPGLPEDLVSLAADLLRPSPAGRPLGREVLRRLGGMTTRKTRGTLRIAIPQDTAFVGRIRELRWLDEAYLATQNGMSATVYIHGDSGLGKSAMVRQFFARLQEREGGAVVILAGRCYERESVPYKALDTLVDALSLYLRGLPGNESESLLPRDLSALTRLFPVLKRVETVASGRRRAVEIPDPNELRRRAYGALRDLLSRLSANRPLVLFVDDLQWGDEESSVLLGELIRPPDPPALLLIACSRSDDGLNAQLRSRLGAGGAGSVYREIALDELSFDNSWELALTLSRRDGSLPEERARAIAREARGNPLFIDELVRFSRVPESAAGPSEAPTTDSGVSAGEKGVTDESDGAHRNTEPPVSQGDLLGRFIRARIDRLTAAARLILEMVAVAGRPIELGIIQRATGLGPPFHEALDALRSRNLVRGRGNRSRDPVESFHDRIRETVIQNLDPEILRDRHARLALALEAEEKVDPETLADHFLGAQMFDRAAEYAAIAADRAMEALAFDRAARLYRVALELQSPGVTRVHNFQAKLADALASGGRGAEAARAYLAAAVGAKKAAGLEFQRRAAEQFLRSGHIDEGLRLIEEILPVLGLRLAKSPRHALISLLWQRAKIAVRGFEFVARDATELSQGDLIQIDTCWTVATGLGLVDNIRGAEFQARHLELALRAGEPGRAARALACEVGYSAAGGLRSAARTAKLALAARTAAELSGSPHAFGLAIMTEGLAAFLEQRWQVAREVGEKAETILRENCTGIAWEIGTTQLYVLKSLELLGALRDFSRRLPRLVKEAVDRGDHYSLAGFRLRFGWLAHLIDDDVEGARFEVEHALESWSHRSFHLQHFWKLFAEIELDLHRGSGVEAAKRLDSAWRELDRSLLLRIQLTRIFALEPRCRAALAASGESTSASEKERFLRSAERDARRLEKEGTPWGSASASLGRAGVAVGRGRPEEAVGHLGKAEKLFGSADMRLHQNVAVWRRGELLLGDEGKGLIQGAESWMRSQGIKNPAAFVRRLAPWKR